MVTFHIKELPESTPDDSRFNFKITRAAYTLFDMDMSAEQLTWVAQKIEKVVESSKASTTIDFYEPLEKGT